MSDSAVAQGLDSTEPQRIQEELIALGLYEHIKDVLPKDCLQYIEKFF